MWITNSGMDYKVIYLSTPGHDNSAGFWNTWMILIKVVTVPATNPMKPKRLIKMFFTSFQLHLPISGQNMMISRRGGKMSARVLLARAPIKEIIRSRCGIVTATPTEAKQKGN